MYNIEPKQTTVIRRSVVITLDEDEIAQILVDPRKFQKELRSVKSKWAESVSTWSATGQAPKASEKKWGEAAHRKFPAKSAESWSARKACTNTWPNISALRMRIDPDRWTVRPM